MTTTLVPSGKSANAIERRRRIHFASKLEFKVEIADLDEVQKYAEECGIWPDI